MPLWIATPEEIAGFGRCGCELGEDDAEHYLSDGTPLCGRCSDVEDVPD